MYPKCRLELGKIPTDDDVNEHSRSDVNLNAVVLITIQYMDPTRWLGVRGAGPVVFYLSSW